MWLPPASSHAGQPCATGTWVLLQRVRRRLGGAGRLAAPSGLQALLPPAASHCPGRPRALIRPGAGMGARPWGRAGTAAGLAPGSQQPGDGHRAGHQQLLDFRAGLTETLPALWFVYFFFFSFFTVWFIVGNVGDRVGVSKAIADLAEPSKLLRPCRILSGGVQVWRRASSHPLHTVLFRVGELLGSTQVCCYGSITIFFPQDRILEKYWINSHIPCLSSGVRVRSSWVSYAS